jgi:para-aminobenzoate synthetase component I
VVQQPSYAWPEKPNWRALAGIRQFLVRRSADADTWVLGLGVAPAADPKGLGLGSVGHLGFGYAQGADHVASRHLTPDAFGEEGWWVPAHLIHVNAGNATQWSQSGSEVEDGEWRKDLFLPSARPFQPKPVGWRRHTSRDRYLSQVRTLLHHIQRGDIYEVNYCTERSAVLPELDPFEAFGRLLEWTDAPFAAFYRRGDQFALCMSPERYLHMEGRTVITQPMKGTRKRGGDPELDQVLRDELAADPKERSENIMAVDVARHDLSRVAMRSSVHVPELCAVKTYPNVHQLVSTIRAELRDGLGAWDAIRATFPMASMTGAPKRRALQLIDAVEDQPRGLFSGSMGYQLPDGTLDLNVVIRTITYDASTGRASLITGSAITALSDPEAEWEECELKARSVLSALGHVE